MPVCPTCHAEYMDGRVECVDCGVALIDDLSEIDDDPEEADGHFVPFRTYPSRVFAEMIVEALAHQGIPAMVKTDELFGSATGAATKIVVWVPDAQKEEAANVADGTLDPL